MRHQLLNSKDIKLDQPVKKRDLAESANVAVPLVLLPALRLIRREVIGLSELASFDRS